MFPNLFKAKNVKITFLIDRSNLRKRMEWEDADVFDMIQAGQRPSNRQLRLLTSRFMVDEKNEYLSTEQALKVLGSLKLEETDDVIKKFMEAFTGSTIPPVSGNGSNLPSVAGPVPTFPPGSVS